MSRTINSAKKLLLTATFLTPLLLAMAGAAMAQDDQDPTNSPSPQTTTQPSDDTDSTANELGQNDFGEDDNAIGDVAEGNSTDIQILSDPWVVEQGDPNSPDPYAPTGTFNATFVKIVSHDCYFWKIIEYVNVYTQESQTFEVQLGYDTYCDRHPEEILPLTDIDLSDFSGGQPTEEPLVLPPATEDDPPATLPPGIDWVKPGTNGTSYEHHTDGSMEIKGSDGKVIGRIAPPMTIPQSPKQAGTDAPLKNSGTGMKSDAAKEQHAGKSPQHENQTAAAAPTRTDSQAAKTAAVTKTTAKTSSLAAVKSPSKAIGNLGHARGVMSHLGAGGLVSHLGGGMMHLGGMHMGGMHMGGAHMGMR